MEQNHAKRKSHCSICGKRLSAITADGSIRWKPSVVDDQGIHCKNCVPGPDGKNTRKPPKE